jgi:hypothetical protein
MDRKLAEELAEGLGEPILFADGHDEALVGIGRQFNTYFAVYSTKKVIEGLMAQGMDDEEAREHFDFNIVGAYVGERTPVFILDGDEDIEVALL